ncbi:MAG: bifunctional phosphopantothenoylcysteine decarboxylase/phosphopantothenate--cysteine ligase CoaBC, partial [Bacteroidota bacterium]
AGAEVKVVTTANALWFVTRVSLESLSQNKIYDQVFGPENDYTTEHISLTDWGDCMVVAPATANIMGKYANGIADDALSTTLMAFNRKVFVAPAMNCKMYENFAFQRNLKYLLENEVEIIEPASGYLACGYEGKGRMEEPEEIFARVERYFASKNDFQGKKVLITAGPTYEAIDPVRFIGNHSTGKMGFAIAEALASRGAEVTLVAGPVVLSTPKGVKNRIDVVTAEQMYKETMNAFSSVDAAVMTAAVADFKPSVHRTSKIKKGRSDLKIDLVATPDILHSLGEKKNKNQVLVGFALETDNETENARKKLLSKNLDFIVLNSLNDPGAGFGGDYNKVSFLDNKNHISRFELKTKKQVAHDIADRLKTCFSEVK